MPTSGIASRVTDMMSVTAVWNRVIIVLSSRLEAARCRPMDIDEVRDGPVQAMEDQGRPPGARPARRSRLSRESALATTQEGMGLLQGRGIAQGRRPCRTV